MSVECYRIAKIICQKDNGGYTATGEVICRTQKCPFKQSLPSTEAASIEVAIRSMAGPADKIIRESLCPRTKAAPKLSPQ